MSLKDSIITVYCLVDDLSKKVLIGPAAPANCLILENPVAIAG